MCFQYFCTCFMKRYFLAVMLTLGYLFSCNTHDNNARATDLDSTTSNDSSKILNVTKPVVEKKPGITYTFMKREEWQVLKDSFEGVNHIDILNAINRVDTRHLKGLDSILVPSDYSHELKDYLPFPHNVEQLKDVNKILLFSYPAQVFAAYENGKMILTGPTSMGRKTKQTPQRLYFTNWKSKETTSTVDNAWLLKWNFNVHNFWGVGFHEYALPGYPASHSCMRLLEKDAKFLYDWADQWRLQEGSIVAYGTPVIVFGKYPFGETRPWRKLTEHPNYLTLNADSIFQFVQPHLEEILTKQQERNILPIQN